MKDVLNQAIKYKNLYLLNSNDYLLISNNIKTKFNLKFEEIIKNNKKEFGTFKIIIFYKFY